MHVSPQLRAVLIAGALAVTALALGFVTLSMNQSSSSAAPKQILSLKARGLASAKPAVKPAKPAAAKPKPKVKPVNSNVVNALAAGLPRSVALQFATHRTVVVELYSKGDPVDRDAQDEAAAGAALAGSGFVSVNVDREGGDAAALTRVVGALPAAPAALIYQRPATLYVSLSGFNDRTTVAQAAANASGPNVAPAAQAAVPAPAPAVPATAPVDAAALTG